MIIYPAIDVLNGQAVRLYKGDYNQATVYGKPLHMAKEWQSQGCNCLHVVDLNGAKKNGNNLETIKTLVNKACFIQVGGGIRDIETAKLYLDIGVNQVIIGTAAVNDQSLLKELLTRFPNQITVGVDAKDGKVAVNGWTEETPLHAETFIQVLESMGARRIIYTDISKDGTLTGPNFEMYRSVLSKTSLQIIASGGISSAKDVEKLKAIGLQGVVIGKALYEKRFTLKEVL